MSGVNNCVCLLILLLCFTCISCEDSDEMWWNHEFVFSIPAMLVTSTSYPPVVYITTSSTRNLRTTLAHPSTGYEVTSTVSLSSPAIINLEVDKVRISDIQIGPHDGPQNTTIIIRSEGIVSVHAIDNNHSSGDGFVVYPNSQLGTEYYVPSYTPASSFYTSFFCVSSIQPSTLINIKTKEGQMHNITLRQYESYRFDGGNGEDLSGTLVQSDKPIAVISGVVTRIHSHTGTTDGIIEQLTPTNQWRSNFILTPFLTLSSGYVYRVYSMNIETIVSLSENITRQLEPGSFYEGNVEGDRVLTLTANNPVMVVQYTTNDSPRGDPSMVIIPPLVSFTQGMVTFPVIEYVATHEYYINVVTDCSNVDGLFLDNMTDIRNWDRLTTEDQEICCVRRSVTPGQHTVSVTDPTASFYVLVYGIRTQCCSAHTYTASTYYVEDTFEGTKLPTMTTTEAVKDFVKVIQVEQTEIVISWESFQADENIDHFRIFYNIGDSLTFKVADIVNVNGTISMKVLSGLIATTLYTVRVEAYTETGRVLNVGEIQVTTTSEILQVEWQKSTEVRVRWDGFQTEEDIIHFRVLYTSEDLSTIESVNINLVDNMQHYAVISGLEPATLYIILVEALTDSSMILIVGEVTVTTETAPDTANISLVIGSAVGGVVLVIIIILITVVCTSHHRQSNSTKTEPQYAMTIHAPGNQENATGDINEGYEVPPGLQNEHNVDIQPYMGLDGTQTIDPYE